MRKHSGRLQSKTGLLAVLTRLEVRMRRPFPSPASPVAMAAGQISPMAAPGTRSSPMAALARLEAGLCQCAGEPDACVTDLCNGEVDWESRRAGFFIIVTVKH